MFIEVIDGNGEGILLVNISTITLIESTLDGRAIICRTTGAAIFTSNQYSDVKQVLNSKGLILD